MKKIFATLLLLCTIILSFTQVSADYPQQTVDNFPQLSIELWPDFDQESVLVLITGLLPIDTPLPADITLPLPANASLNAIARIDNENGMFDDVVYVVDENNQTVTITLTDLRFRMEYYQPYQKSGLTREFSFNWSSPVDITAFALNVQQPRHTDQFELTPNASNILDGQYELKYHNGRLQSILKGQNITTTLKYTLLEEKLSIERSANLPAQTTSTLSERVRANWQRLIFPVTGFFVALAFLIYGLMRGKKTSHNRCSNCNIHIAKQTREQGVKFCPNCGHTLN